MAALPLYRTYNSKATESFSNIKIVFNQSSESFTDLLKVCAVHALFVYECVCVCLRANIKCTLRRALSIYFLPDNRYAKVKKL